MHEPSHPGKVIKEIFGLTITETDAASSRKECADKDYIPSLLEQSLLGILSERTNLSFKLIDK